MTLEEIYDAFEQELALYREEIEKIEIQTEIHLCCPNTEMLKLYHRVLQSGKTVIITSDMYLPEECIKAMLTKCGFIFVKSSADVWIYTLIRGCEFFCGQLIPWKYLGKYVDFVWGNKEEIRKHIKPNVTLFIPTIAISIYRTMDKIMLGHMVSNTEVGYYHSAENIIFVPLAIVTALGNVMLPRTSNMLAKNTSKEYIEQTFLYSTKVIIFIVSLLCFGIMSVAKQFVPLFYGRGFDKCIALYYALLPSCLFCAFASVIRTQYLLPNREDRIYIFSLFGGAGVNLILNVLLIPRIQSIGAAIGTLFAEASVCLIQVIFVWKKMPVKYGIVNALPFICSGVFMVAIFCNYEVPISDVFGGLVVKIILCGIFYLLCVGILQCIKHIVVHIFRNL